MQNAGMFGFLGYRSGNNIAEADRGTSSRSVQRIPPPDIPAEVVRAAPANIFPQASSSTASSDSSMDQTSPFANTEMSLQDLRIEDEPDTSLVTVPMQQMTCLSDIPIPPDDRTAGLTGTPYFRSLVWDEHLPRGLQNLCYSRKLAQNTSLGSEHLELHTEKLKLIASRCRTGSDEFKSRIDRLALEAKGFCDDRASYFIEQMHGLAMIDFLTEFGHRDEKMLFNLGVAFCKLELVQNETVKRIASANNQNNNIVDVLVAEYLLQDPLALPVCHPTPQDLNCCNMTPELANQIKDAVNTKLVHNNSAHVIDFLSTWEPWVKYIESSEKNQPDLEFLHEIHTELVQTVLDHPEFPEVIKNDFTEAAMNQYRDQKRKFVADKSREFLINHRTEHLLENGVMPRVFMRNVR